MKRWYLIVDKSYVLPSFDAGAEIWMVDFEQDDHRNMTRRIRDRSQLSPEILASPNVFFYKAEEEKGRASRR